jgi:hypothetical protein
MSGHSDTYGTEVYNDTPIGYWRFDGDTVDEMGGTSMTLIGGPPYGSALISPYSGAQSLNCDGANDYAAVPDDAKFDYTFNMSVEAWVNADVLSGTGMFVSKYSWGIGHLAGGAPRFWTYNGTTVTNCTGSTLSTGTNYHIVGTYDGTNMKLYVNGSLANTVAFTASFPTNANSLLVGSWDTTTNYFDGRVDEAAVYNRALTAQEISDHYSIGNAAIASKSLPSRRRPLHGLIAR